MAVTLEELYAKPQAVFRKPDPDGTGGITLEQLYDEPTDKRGFLANYKNPWASITEESMPASLYQAYQKGAFSHITPTSLLLLTNPLTAPAAAKNIFGPLIKQQEEDLQHIDFGKIYEGVKEDPAAAAAHLIVAVQADPELLFMPMGLGGSLARTLGAVAGRAGRVVGRAVEGGVSGAGIMTPIEAAKMLKDKGYISPEGLVGPSEFGFLFGGTLNAAFGRSGLPKPGERPGADWTVDAQGRPMKPDGMAPTPAETAASFSKPQEFASWLSSVAETQATAPKPRVKLKSTPEQIGETVEPAALPSRGDRPAVMAWAKEQGLGLSDAYKKLTELKAGAKVLEEPALPAGPPEGVPERRLVPRATMANQQKVESLLKEAQMEGNQERIANLSNQLREMDIAGNQADRMLFGGPGKGQVGAVKPLGGMWHPEAVERLAGSLKESLLRGTDPTEAGFVKARSLIEWSNSRVKSYLNKYAGTERDPLKDVEVPFGEGTRRWGELTDKAIRKTRAGDIVDPSAPKAPPNELVYNLEPYGPYNPHPETDAIKSYLSHVGDYLRQNVDPAKLSQYDLVRAVRETAENDKRMAKEMEKAAAASSKDLPVYKEYPDGYRWVELKLPEKLTEEQAKTVKKIVDTPENQRLIAGERIPGPYYTDIKNNYTGQVARGRTPEEAHLASQLAQEGNQMGHCVGGYCQGVSAGESRVFSLRDPKGLSHVTVEVSPENKVNTNRAAPPEGFQGTIQDWLKQSGKDIQADITQIKGKQNRAPEAKYLPYVQDFVKSGKWGEVGDLGNTGLIRHTESGRYLTPEEARGEGLGYQGTTGDLHGDLRGPGRRQRGELDPRLAARLAAVGIGATTGAALDPDSPITGAAIGAVTAGAAISAALSPRAVVQTFKDLIQTHKRVRIDTLADTHEHTINMARYDTWLLGNRLRELVPDPARRAAVAHSLEGDASIQLTPKEQQAAKTAREFLVGLKNIGLEKNILTGALEDYVTHLWQPGSKSSSALWNAIDSRRSASMSPQSRFAEHRTVPTIAEGKKLGLTPVTEDIAEIVQIYGNSLIRTVANKQLLDALKAEKLPDGTPLVAGTDVAPRGYVPIDHPQLYGLRVHPEIAPSLKFSFDNTDLNLAFRIAEGAAIASKRALVSFSLFHAKALTDAYIGAGGNPANIPGFVSGTNSLLQSVRDGGGRMLVDRAYKGGLKFTLEKSPVAVEDVGDTFYAMLKDFQAMVDKIIPWGGTAVKGITAVNRQVDKFMWERLHAGMKLDIFAKEYEKLLRNNAEANTRDPSIPIKSETELAKIAASYTNDLFGGLNWRMLAESARTKIGQQLAMAAYSPTGRRAMQILLFAPDWTISTTRAALGAFRPEGSLKGLLKPEVLADLHRQYLLRSAVYYTVVGDALNQAWSGKHIWENDDPTMIDMGDGRKMQWSKHTMEPVHWITKPRQQTLNKLGVPIKLPAEILTGKEYLSAYGHAPDITSVPAHIGKAFLPISVHQGFEAGEGSGIAGFLGSPIFGKTTEQRQEDRLRRATSQTVERLEKRMEKLGR